MDNLADRSISDSMAKNLEPVFVKPSKMCSEFRGPPIQSARGVLARIPRKKGCGPRTHRTVEEKLDPTNPQRWVPQTRHNPTLQPCRGITTQKMEGDANPEESSLM